MKNKAVISIDSDLLLNLIDRPAGDKVLSMEWDTLNNTIRLFVESEEFPGEENGMYPVYKLNDSLDLECSQD